MESPRSRAADCSRSTMHFLTAPECSSWAQSHGHPATTGVTPLPIACPSRGKVSFRVPSDAGRRVALAAALFGPFRSQPEILVWLGGWDVWPSSQHKPLIMSLRAAMGEHRDLIEAPGFLAQPDDAEDSLSFVVAAMLFTWDCAVLGSKKSCGVSHDEVGWYCSAEPDELDRACRAIALCADNAKVEPIDAMDSR